MDNIKRLESAYRFCSLLNIEAIKEEIDSFLVGYSLDDIKLQNDKYECKFSNYNNNTICLSISPTEINLYLYRYNGNQLSSIIIREDQTLRQVDVEKRENGIIYKEIQKQFAPSSRFKNKNVVVSLIEDSYVFSKDKINKIINKDDFNDVRFIFFKIKNASMKNELKDLCDLHNRFSTHMNYYFQWEGGRQINDNIYPTITYLNGEDVSRLFDVNDGPDKLNRVYDLYNGIISIRNECDINLISLGFLSADAFGLRELKGINEQENELVGKSTLEVSNDYLDYLVKLFYDKFGYKGEIKTDRESLLKGITHQMSGPELAKQQIDKITESGPKRLLKRIFKRR